MINLDAKLRNADWTKVGHWDLTFVETEEQLIQHLEAKGMTMEQFKKMPAYEGWLKFQAQKGQEG